MPNPEPAPFCSPTCATCPIHQLHMQTAPGTKLRPRHKLDIHTELTIACEYCRGNSSDQLAKRYRVDSMTIRNILRCYNQVPRTYSAAQRNRRNSPVLVFPLSSEVPRLILNPENGPYLSHLIATAILTEGAAGYRKDGHPYLTFTNKSEAFHAIFADLTYYAYGVEPSAYCRPYWSRAGKQGAKAYYTTYFRRHDTDRMLTNLLQLTPIFRTRPKRRQTWSQYLKELPQPTLRFLLENCLPNQVVVFAIRLAMSAEGTISPIFRRDGHYPHPHLVFSCSHPRLLTDWQRLFQIQGILFHRAKIKLETATKEAAQRFLDLGGFFPGVPIRENSYYHGIDRQDLLKAILIGRKNFPTDPKLPLPERHALLRKKAMDFGLEENEKRKEA